MHVLPIFPRSGFDQSVTTPVLLGVLVSWFFTETVGWVFAGLVVPGYLAAVFLLEPVAGAIDLFEAALTFFAARAIGEYLPRIGVTSRIFGRERFFLVVLVSILIRLAVEGWLFPKLVPHVTWAYSIGLVVVPLAANACWKTGFLRGIVQNGVPTLIVYLLLKYLFVPYTNLSLAGFELSTENLAAGFLSSPKAYIVLVTGAMLAAQANLRYGWDFNGILVPALLALAIVEPIKYGTTFAEALLLVFTVAILLKLTPLKRANIEGPRRTVLFFTVDYALRFIWAASMGKRLPGGDIVEFMGFGYLLPTLLAVKISQKASAPLVLLPTFKVSIAGFLLGSLIGFAGHLFDRAAEAASEKPSTRPMPKPPVAAPAAALWVSQLAIEGLAEPDTNVTGDLARIRDTLKKKPKELDEAPIADGIVVVRERFDTLIARHGMPVYLYRPDKLPSAPTVALVPTPLACPACAALAGTMLAKNDVDVVVVSGIEEPLKAVVALETTAHAAARNLGGKLIVVRDRDDPRLREGSQTLPPTKTSPPSGANWVKHRGETVLTVDPVIVANELAAPRPPISLDTATTIAEALQPIHAATYPGDLEHLIVLRRLVLEPILAPDASTAARALAPFAAHALGYHLTAPTKWTGGQMGYALLPSERGLPLAVFTRQTGVKDLLVEAPTASRHGVRDLAIRVAMATEADALVLGEVFNGAMRGGAVRAAHGAATNGRAPTVFLVREDRNSNDALLSVWMDDGKTGAMARLALDKIGVAPTDAPPDLATRDLATRTLLRPTAIVALTVGGKKLEQASLDATRRAHDFMPDLPVRDGSLADAAKALAGAIEPGRPPTVREIDEVVRRAASDASISAARRLTNEIGRAAVQAAIARVKEGSFVVAVARTDRAQLVVTSALEGGSADVKYERRGSLAACVEKPVVSGVCEAPR